MPALFIVNPAARGGRGARAEGRIRTALATLDTGAEIVRTDAPGQAEVLAAKAARDGFAPVVAVGGDGTVHEVVNGLLRTPQPTLPPDFGVVPTGNGNDFARTVHLPRKIESAVSAILQGPRRTVDVGRCGNRVFLNAAGVGFDAEVVGVVASAGPLLRSSGPLLYPLAVVRALPRYRVQPMSIELDGQSLERRALLVAVANGSYYGGGFRICPAADPGDGWLDVCVLGDLSRGEAIRLLPRLRKGTHVGAAKVEHFRARVVRISAGDAPAQLDGEQLEGGPTGHEPAEFRVLAGALRLCGAAEPEVTDRTP